MFRFPLVLLPSIACEGRYYKFTFVPLIAAFALITGCTSSSPDPEVNTIATYRLTTSFQGDTRALSTADLVSIANDETVRVAQLNLAASDDSESQQWVFTKKDDGTFGISSVLLGVGFSIDVINDGVLDKIQLATTGTFSGQEWTVTPLDNGFCRLNNNFTGPEIALDIRSEGDQNEPTLEAIGDFSGQHWKIIPATNTADATDPVLNSCLGA